MFPYAQISWFEPSNLRWLMAIPVVVVCLAFGLLRLKRRLILAQQASTVGARWAMSRRRGWARVVVLSLALFLLIVSSAGPRWGWTWVESRQSGVDIVVAVDVSRSMMAKDLEPSRLERARRMMIDLLDVASGDRIGLVVFAGAAFVQCPLTVDHVALRSFVDALSTDMIPVGGTDLAGALRESLKALDAGGEEQGMGKLIVLMTDGEDHIGGVDEAVQEVVASRAKVVTVGIASKEGSPVVDDRGGFIKDLSGNVVISRLNEEPLLTVAEKTGGTYIHAASSLSSVATFYQDVLRSKGTVRETQSKRERVWFERFQWTAALSLLLLVLESLLMDVRLRSVFGVAVLVLTWSLAPKASAETDDRQRYNKAVQALETGDVELARKEFQEIIKQSSGEVQRRSLYNLGNLLATAGDYAEAAKLYEQALRLDYQDQQVRDNLAWVKGKSKSEQKTPDKAQSKDQKEQEKEQKSENGQGGSQDQKTEPSSRSAGGQESGETEGDKADKKTENTQSGQSDKNDKQSQSPEQSRSQEGESQEKTSASQNSGGDTRAPKDAQTMTPEQAEKLLRAAPDDRKAFVPIFRSDKAPPQRAKGKDW